MGGRPGFWRCSTPSFPRRWPQPQYVKQFIGVLRTVAWPGQNRMPGWVPPPSDVLQLGCRPVDCLHPSRSPAASPRAHDNLGPLLLPAFLIVQKPAARFRFATGLPRLLGQAHSRPTLRQALTAPRHLPIRSSVDASRQVAAGPRLGHGTSLRPRISQRPPAASLCALVAPI